MLRRHLLIVVPAAASTLVAFVLLGPGRFRPVHAARVLSAGDDLRALRVITITRDDSHEEPLAPADLALYLDAESTPRWQGPAGPGGVTEILLDPPVASGTGLRVMSGEALLAAGKATTSGGPAQLQRGTVARLGAGGLALTVDLERGALVPPFAERVHLQLSLEGRPAAGQVTVSAGSADPAEATLALGEDGRGALELTPLAQPVQLSFEARAAGRSLRGDATLPVTMSGMYVAPELRDGRLDIVSSGPRDVAFLSFYDAAGRASGAMVELKADERGFFRGAADLPGPGVTAIVASAEAHEKGPSTTAWPLPGEHGRVSAPTLGPALDGTAAALERERRRVSRVRIITVTALSIAAVLELLLLLWAGRQEGQRVTRLAEQLAEGDQQGASPRGPQPNAGQRGMHSEDLDLGPGGAASRSLATGRAWIVAIGALVLLSFVAIISLLVH